MRIVSLLPSATEVLFALGLDEEIVGVSHECDYPLRAKTKTAVVSSRLPKDATPLETDRLVREHVERGESIYAVNRDLLEELAPDLIFPQDLCHVCAATPEELGAALATISKYPQIISLDPHDLGDVWRDILWIGEVTGRRERAQELVTHIGERLGRLERHLAGTTVRPRVIVLEWLQPFYVGGHWVQEIVNAAPEVIFIAPCGYNAEQARDEYSSLAFPEDWYAIPAVRDARVFALDANGHVSRPAGRLVTGTESMAKGMHPELEVPVKAMLGMLSVPVARNRSAAASAPSF